MPFALTPSDGPPRLLRYVDPFDADDTLSVLDTENNVLFIDREKWRALTWWDQHALIRTKSRITFYRRGRMVEGIDIRLVA